ncbi:MAG: SpoIIE family protein phosphatase [Deltaproteobacteria bacterium]|nr:SpoIIE family protein phosphatase [Deltaproteobacteria bacterium]
MNRRILVIDDNPAIHDDIRKVLMPATPRLAELSALEAELFGGEQVAGPEASFELESAFQGQQGLTLLEDAVAAHRPYAMAIVDVRMPPGWDGVETTGHLWKADPRLYVVLCTAYSDYSWDETVRALGQTERLLILKKPFDTVELLQLAHALTEKWNQKQESEAQLASLKAEATEHEERLQSLSTQLQAAAISHLEQELSIATRIQTQILPRVLQAPGLEVAARMAPVSEVGGDYYDFVPTVDGAWIGIGDVAGHGLTAGLVMLMLQSSISALVRRQPTAMPDELLAVVNEVLYDNVRQRLKKDDHATLTLLRYTRDGTVCFAGAHEELIVCRRETGACEQLETPGAWVGVRRDIRKVTTSQTLTLTPGDILLLHTDGISEARSAGGEELGVERLSREVSHVRHLPVTEILDHLFDVTDRFTKQHKDDRSLMILRYVG